MDGVGVRGLMAGRALLYPPDGDVAAAVDTAVSLVHGRGSGHDRRDRADGPHAGGRRLDLLRAADRRAGAGETYTTGTGGTEVTCHPVPSRAEFADTVRAALRDLHRLREIRPSGVVPGGGQLL
ncbi:hypothetical protein J2S43_004688 [Catenuloplanes nepalensis]|uniref:Cgl0159-like domain-containing protein n=1 Tax=Catenuloplanes nepalensis TaxID=587533 RepID=A0ABT9MYR4_9ACTN|nr:hypothetical protein [Catenuloplanes nepalensis]MDP9796176.1 hypothetical protein [Catenuloplanes nepalensis]